MLEGLFRGEHLLVILVIALIMFPGKVGSLGGSLGKSIRDFKRAMNGADEPPAPRSEQAQLPPSTESRPSA